MATGRHSETETVLHKNCKVVYDRRPACLKQISVHNMHFRNQVQV